MRVHRPVNLKDCPLRELPSREGIYVWAVDLDAPEDVVESLYPLLTIPERMRAMGMATDAIRRRYSIGRGCLRILLAEYTGREPYSIRLRSGEFGKPFMEGGKGESTLQFNMSHSGGKGVIALCGYASLGIDLEAIQSYREAEAMIGRFWSPSEKRTLINASPEMRAKAFYRWWTIKEAAMKCHGTGITAEWDRLSVETRPDFPPAILSSGCEELRPDRFAFSEHDVFSDHCCTLAWVRLPPYPDDR